MDELTLFAFACECFFSFLLDPMRLHSPMQALCRDEEDHPQTSREQEGTSCRSVRLIRVNIAPQ